MKPYCELCESHHEKYQGHVFATAQARVVTPVVTPKEAPVVEESRQVKWQRDNRERYNAKMRAYRAARASGSAS